MVVLLAEIRFIPVVPHEVVRDERPKRVLDNFCLVVSRPWLRKTGPEILLVRKQVPDALGVLLGKYVVGMVVQWQRERHREEIKRPMVASSVQRRAYSLHSLCLGLMLMELLLKGVLIVGKACLAEAGGLLEVLLLL